ncbi:hypothetical protein EVAR_34472_1 [Eumeta japonica]|uniref:Secreted protein n=1 Tax=Eumeta variegata TaxID=151549 RepID=A0A4C1WUA0_EUMVA|nr:hypothetical protein EVAR_34472_1 [Eumeta japonica]
MAARRCARFRVKLESAVIVLVTTSAAGYGARGAGRRGTATIAGWEGRPVIETQHCASMQSRLAGEADATGADRYSICDMSAARARCYSVKVEILDTFLER